MTSKLFIVYRITNIIVRKHYYGYKSCSHRDPKEIIGKTYFSSSSDKEFITEQKNHPERFRYKIVARFNTKEEALEREIRLHKLFDVGRNVSFYNKVKQTSSAFDSSGKAVFICLDGERRLLEIGSPEALNSTRLSRKTTIYVDDHNNVYMVESDDERVKTGFLRHIRKDKVSVIDRKTGKYTSVDIRKFEESNGDYVGVTAGKKSVLNKKTGVVECIDKESFSDEIYEELNRDMVVSRDEFGNFLRVRRDDDRIRQGNLVGATCGYIRITNGSDNTSILDTEDIPEGWYRGISTQKKTLINKDNIEKWISEDELENYIKEGWEIGQSKSRKTSRGRVLMHDGKRTILVDNEEVGAYKLLGFQMGRVNKYAMRGKTRLIRGSESIMIDVSEKETIEKMCKEGWQKPKRLHNSGRITINNGVVNRMIPKEDENKFLSDGWRYGRLKNGRNEK